jgi:hypothetical protein
MSNGQWHDDQNAGAKAEASWAKHEAWATELIRLAREYHNTTSAYSAENLLRHAEKGEPT